MPTDENIGQSPEAEGTELRDAASQIAGLLDEDGQYNPGGRMSRAHPDYDESADPRATGEDRPRNEKGQFTKQEQETELTDDQLAADQQAGNEEDEDTELTEDGDTDETQDQSATEDTDADAENEEPIRTVAEMAAALDMSVDDFMASITDSFRASDEDVTVTLAEMRKGYQKDADYRKQTGKLADERRALEMETQNRMQQFETANQDAASALMATQQIFENMLNHPDMQQLRQSDPAEWNARRTELGEQIQYIQNARQQAAQRYQQFQNDQLTQLRAREEKALKDKRADFGEKDAQVAREIMGSIGYSQDEIKGIFDHRLVLAALEMNDLRSEVEALRAEKVKATDTAKRVKKNIPEMQRPGKKKTANAANMRRDNISNLSKRLKNSGRIEDAAKVIEQLI